MKKKKKVWFMALTPHHDKDEYFSPSSLVSSIKQSFQTFVFSLSSFYNYMLTKLSKKTRKRKKRKS